MLQRPELIDNGQMTTANSIGPCCKMFFPMTETSGTTITDAVGGAVLTPTTIGFNIANTVEVDTGGAFIGLTSGAFPAIGTKSFCLFSVFDGVSNSGGAGLIAQLPMDFVFMTVMDSVFSDQLIPMGSAQKLLQQERLLRLVNISMAL